MRRFFNQFRRLHLAGLGPHRLAMTSAVAGVALGAALVVATQLLTQSLTAPFESLPTLLGSADFVEVRPVVADRLANADMEALRAESGITGAFSVAAVPTFATTPTRQSPLLLLAVEDPDELLGSRDATPVREIADDAPDCAGGGTPDRVEAPSVSGLVLLSAADEALGRPACVSIGGASVAVDGAIRTGLATLDEVQDGLVGLALAGPARRIGRRPVLVDRLSAGAERPQRRRGPNLGAIRRPTHLR